ncbi:MAG: CHAT domain-containing protein [Synechococcales bacterium]|nr:CHAT domain-containing protein [Synechococcales bacterium]
MKRLFDPVSPLVLRRCRLLLAFLLGLVLTLSSTLMPALPGFSQDIAPTSSIPAPDATRDLLEQGRASYRQGDWEGAIALWQTVLQANSVQENGLDRVAAWTYLGMAYQKVGDWAAAEAAIDAALQGLEGEAVKGQTGERSRLLAQALNARGQLELHQGQADRAILTWQQVTQRYRDLNDAAGVTGSLINQARALEVNGYFQRACRVLLEAVDLDRQSCEGNAPPDGEQIVQSIQAQPDVRLQLLALRSLGSVFHRQGYLPQAQRLLQTGLDLAQTQGDVGAIALSQLHLAQVLEDQYQQAAFLADRSQRQGDRQTALDLARQALAHYAAVSEGLGDRLLQAQAALHQFDLLLRINRWLAFHGDRLEQAEFLAQLQDGAIAPETLADLPPSRALFYSQVNLARTLMRQGDALPPPAAAALLEQLMEQMQRQAAGLPDSQAQSYAWGTLGQFYETLALSGSQPTVWQQAQDATRQALGLAQAVQAWHIAYQWQWQLGRIYRAQGAQEDAIAHYQAAVATLDMVRQDLRAVESQVQFSFLDDVEPVYRELVALLVQSPDGTPPSQANLQLAIEEINALQLTELENFLSCNLTATVTLDQPQAESRAAVLYPILLPEQLVVIARLPQSEALQFHAVHIPRGEAVPELEAFRRQVEQRYLTDSFLALSGQIYDWLIRPFQEDLTAQGVQTLVFVSDGILRNLPMAALYDGDRFLVEDYAIALSPGLQIPASTPLGELRLDAIAFGLSEIRQDFPPHADFAPLINVERELTEIATQVPSRKLLNQAFTSEALQSWIRRVDSPVVHLATHGQFSSDPNETFLLAWDRRITLRDFGELLQIREEQNNPAIELLVLSACKTADGDDRATLGLAGIAIQAGARSTIGSLWFVDDQGTAELMGRLYQELTRPEAGMTRAEALRRAQVDLLHSPGYQAPIFWAPYVLVGNWQ